MTGQTCEQPQSLQAESIDKKNNPRTIICTHRIFQSIYKLSYSQDHTWSMAVQAGTFPQLFFIQVVQKSKILNTNFWIGLEETEKRIVNIR